MHRSPHRSRLHSPCSPHRTLAAPLNLTHAVVPLAGVLAAAALASLAGCHRQSAEAIIVKPPAPDPLRVSEADLARYKPNEAGTIMILMYHDFDAKRPNTDLNRKPVQFRADLQSLYALGYRPVTVSDIIDNNMDVPPGKTPIALTFDDSKPTQFKLITGKDGQPHIDPDCAVGIMEVFHKQHPDWATKGTFFVLPKEGSNYDPFAQTEAVQDKFDYLIKNGYEIANHTSTHHDMHSMPADKVRWELATALHDIKQIAPTATMQVFALPYGRLPRDAQARQNLISGNNGSTTYKHKAVLLAAWRPILSPNTKADKRLAEGGTFCLYDPYRLERVKPDPRAAKQPGTLEYWLRYYQKNPGQRYRSDGNVKVITVPAAHKNDVDEARVRAQHKILQVYGVTTPSKGSPSALHVE